MKKKLFLYASEISIITGHNKYENKNKVITRILSEYFPEQYQIITQVHDTKLKGIFLTHAHVGHYTGL